MDEESRGGGRQGQSGHRVGVRTFWRMVEASGDGVEANARRDQVSMLMTVVTL